MKLAIFHPKARGTIRDFPSDVRREPGKAIFDLQTGVNLTMRLSRSMSSVAAASMNCASGIDLEFIACFITPKLEDSIVIFHAFVKKTQKTPQHEIALAQERLKELLDEKS